MGDRQREKLLQLANEYSGTSRYMRDEVGPQASHVRGAVGISTRGRDTGDGQIFIDLVDVPRLDRDYTVFAYVTQGMELVDRLLEGAAPPLDPPHQRA